jgi:hypothetical protein
MPARLTPFRVATPVAFVVALPTLFPFSVKSTVAPLTPFPPEVSVAERFVVPPNVPVAGATARLVGLVPATLLKHTWTDETDGVTAPLEVDRNAL